MFTELMNGLNWYDMVFLAFVIYFVWGSKNFLATLSDLISFIVTLIISYRLYLWAGRGLVSIFAINKGMAQALGFFLVWFVIESMLFLASRILLMRVSEKIHNHKFNRYPAFIPALIQACILFLLITVTIFSFPVRASIKEDILASKTGPYFINASHLLESRIKNVFGEAVNETINFMTIRQGSTDEIHLGFKAPADSLSVDRGSEETMLVLVNNSRADNGESALSEDEELREVARSYATEMMVHGFFSHTSQVDGSSPADRVERNGISYMVTGENLAYAPDVYLAHQGLMNSPGHRANILSSEYGRVGIGVIDGGIYGRMFVQVFRN